MFHIGKDSRQVFYSSLVFLCCYIILVVIAIRPVFSYDAYWHLQMGKDLVINGLSPWIDHYSFSYPGKEISTVPVLFQVLLSQFVSLFGETEGFYYIRVFYVTLLLSSLFIYFRSIRASGFIIFLLLPLIVYFIHLRLMVRPEIFSYVLMVICLTLYLKAQKSFATRELVYISLLLLFWVNYHSPIIGYIVIFGLFLDKAVNKLANGDDSFSWKFWTIWGCVIFLIGFVRPGGLHFMITVLNVMSDDFGKYTQEYANSYTWYSKNIVVHISWMLSIYVAIWSLLKKQYGFVFIAVIFTYFSWSTMRMITATTLVNLCVLALYISQASFSHHMDKIRSSVKNALLFVSTCVAAIALYFVVEEAAKSLSKLEHRETITEYRYPVQVVDYLKHHRSGGNILNIMSTGGYLLNKLSPEYKVYFDGRTNILYPIDFVKHNVGILNDAVSLDELILNKKVKFALFKNTAENYKSLRRSKKLKLEIADEHYILFGDSEAGAFPLTSMLLVLPSCWNDGLSAAVLQEIEMAEERLSDADYTLIYVHEFLKDFLSNEDKQQFFTSLRVTELHSDGVRRIAYYLARKTGNHEVAAKLFSSIKVKAEYDILMHAYYLAQDKKYREAESLLYYFYTITKYIKNKNLSFHKIELMTLVLEILENESELQIFATTYRGELEGKLKKGGYTRDNDLSFDKICK